MHALAQEGRRRGDTYWASILYVQPSKAGQTLALGERVTPGAGLPDTASRTIPRRASEVAVP
jgi:hypothetical protein